jgi:hypothetical protein
LTGEDYLIGEYWAIPMRTEGATVVQAALLFLILYFANMKAATLHELKQEMVHLSVKQVVDLCLRLGRFKKENKELLTYLLFEADDERTFIQNVKADMDEAFADIPRDNNLYLVKKSLRKILRNTSKYIRFSGSKIVETELLLHYLELIKNSRIPIHKSTALENLYAAQVKKIKKALSGLEEDLQYDYNKVLEELL